ncbi:MAG: CDP-diacylglycerol---glycerol-3-phosphate 3-phosphatidyltransferase [Micromonosporaceae bacterium]|jgi:CDP-diacylglycerol--glycerol-3-phosphate 3-phosphatidyltransferase|nr:CDP-diacylglycerol---glycerol-3-phosphate 3-phosphatidyltransferase [Micromonosporaceae bacterium]
MAKIFSVVTKAGVLRVVDPVARALLRAGVSPDAVTVLGTVGVIAAAVGLASRGHLMTATFVITACALTDLLDGAMARARGTPSRFGALLDSTMDRIADGAVFGGLAYWLAVTDQRVNLVATLICLISGQVVSYVKARAEGLGLSANVGIAERFERLVILGLGGIGHGLGVPYALSIALWLLVALSVVTAGQRIGHVYRQDRASGPPPGGMNQAEPA